MGLLMILLYLSPIVLFFYIYLNRKYSYWQKKGISGPTFPENIYPLGNMHGHFLRDPIEFELYNTKKYGKVYGRYSGSDHSLTISDIELVKTVFIKDFHLFVNRRDFKVTDENFMTNLVFARGEDWKRIRSFVTPAFTSGKLRKMYPLLKNATDKLENYFEKKVNQSVDIKTVISGFTIDVIASTSFGTDTNSNGDRSKFDPFLHHGSRLFQKQSVPRMFFLLLMPPSISKIFNVKHAFPYDSYDFIVKLVKRMLTQSSRRQDLISLLKDSNVDEDELKNINLNSLTATSEIDSNSENTTLKSNNAVPKLTRKLTEQEIIGQCIVFLIAGFETTSATISSTLYNLAKYPNIQDKLHQELNEKLSGIDVSNNLDKYMETVINRSPYLDAVIKETLRMYPPVTRLERQLQVDNYRLGDITLEKGTLIEVPTVSIHYDEEYFQNPTKFEPERFMPENKHKLVPYSYIPFGHGPRMRFAYQEAKIGLASLIQKFRFEMNVKTPTKLKFPARIGICSPDPFELTVKSRY